MLTSQRGPLTLAGRPKGSARLKIGPAGYTGYSAGPLFVIHHGGNEPSHFDLHP